MSSSNRTANERSFNKAQKDSTLQVQLLKENKNNIADELGDLLIVSFSPNRWDDKWSCRQFITREFAHKGHAVIFVEPPCVWGKTRVGGFWPEVDEVEPNLWRYCHSYTLLRFSPRWTRLNRIMETVRNIALRRAIRRISPAPIVIYIWHPKFAEAVGHLGECLVCYHKYDRFPWIGQPSPEFQARELRLVHNANLCFASSREMINLGELDTRFHIVPNGVDWQAYKTALDLKDEYEPEDLRELSHPRLGYIGAINQKLDFDLLEVLASKLEEGCIVLIGPQLGAYELYGESLEKLLRHPKVHYLRAKRFNELLSYVVHFDVGLIPYKMSDAQWTEVCSPLKLYEYLAAGLPVISVDIPAVRAAGEVVNIARTPDEWWRATMDALSQTTNPQIQRRLRIAWGNSWEVRVDEITKHITRKLLDVHYPM